MNKKIFIACDTNKISTAKKIINSTRTNKINIGYKFGLEFWNSKNGRSFISKLKNKVIFADLKLLDIPNTCRSAIKSIKDIKFLRDCGADAFLVGTSIMKSSDIQNSVSELVNAI